MTIISVRKQPLNEISSIFVSCSCIQLWIFLKYVLMCLESQPVTSFGWGGDGASQSIELYRGHVLCASWEFLPRKYIWSHDRNVDGRNITRRYQSSFLACIIYGCILSWWHASHHAWLLTSIKGTPLVAIVTCHSIRQIAMCTFHVYNKFCIIKTRSRLHSSTFE